MRFTLPMILPMIAVAIASGCGAEDDPSQGPATLTDAAVEALDGFAPDAAPDASLDVALDGSFDAAADSQVIDVDAEESCEGIGAPLGVERDPEYETLHSFFGSEWGFNGTTGGGFGRSLKEGHYVALAFDVPPGKQSGRVQWAASAFSGSFRVRISRCPGDLRPREQAPEALSECTTLDASSPEASVLSGPPGSGWCPIDSGRYYLNILADACFESGECSFIANILP